MEEDYGSVGGEGREERPLVEAGAETEDEKDGEEEKVQLHRIADNDAPNRGNFHIGNAVLDLDQRLDEKYDRVNHAARDDYLIHRPPRPFFNVFHKCAEVEKNIVGQKHVQDKHGELQ